MSHSLLLLAIVCLTHAVMAGVWWSGGSLLSLSRTAAWHWLLAPLAHGAALTLLLLHPRFTGWAHLAVADLLALGGFIAMRRGLQWGWAPRAQCATAWPPPSDKPPSAPAVVANKPQS